MSTNQLKELIRIAEALERTSPHLGGSNSDASTPLIPSLLRTTQSGKIATGAKYISVAIVAGSGTILGTSVNTNFEGIDFPYNSAGWGEIPYTIDPSSEFVIITGR